MCKWHEASSKGTLRPRFHIVEKQNGKRLQSSTYSCMRPNTHTHTQAQASRHSHTGKHTYTHAHRKRKLKKKKTKKTIHVCISLAPWLRTLGCPSDSTDRFPAHCSQTPRCSGSWMMEPLFGNAQASGTHSRHRQEGGNKTKTVKWEIRVKELKQIEIKVNSITQSPIVIINHVFPSKQERIGFRRWEQSSWQDGSLRCFPAIEIRENAPREGRSWGVGTWQLLSPPLPCGWRRGVDWQRLNSTHGAWVTVQEAQWLEEAFREALRAPG